MNQIQRKKKTCLHLILYRARFSQIMHENEGKVQSGRKAKQISTLCSSIIPDTFGCYPIVPVLHQRFGQSDGFAALDYGQELVGRALDSPFVHLFPYANDHVAAEPVESIHLTANKQKEN